MDFPEGGGGFSAPRDLGFEAVKVVFPQTIVGSRDGAGLIVHAKDQPCGRAGSEIGFVAEGGKVFTDIGRRIVTVGLLNSTHSPSQPAIREARSCGSSSCVFMSDI